MNAPTAPPPIRGVYETILYALDVPAAAAFYSEVLGLTLLRPPTAQSAVFRLGPDAMLLLFDPRLARQPGRGAPVHGCDGQGHIALRIAPADVAPWLAALTAKGVAIELDRTWEPGGRSIYFRDPAGNSVELAAGEVWGPPLAHS